MGEERAKAWRELCEASGYWEAPAVSLPTEVQDPELAEAALNYARAMGWVSPEEHKEVTDIARHNAVHLMNAGNKVTRLEAERAELVEALQAVVAAWKREADQGDGIDVDHALIFDGANLLLAEHTKGGG